jgi:hypothetical protein
MVKLRPEPSQRELDFDAEPADPAAVASVEEVQRVVAILTEKGQLTAAEICRELERPASENNKRKVRAVARAAFPGIVSFVGSDGYKLLRQCTLEEAWAAVHGLENIERDTVTKKKLLLDAIHSGKVGPS